MFSFVFYSGEMAYDISSIIKTPPQNRDIKQVLLTMLYHAAKIIYRAFTLMIVNNFLYDICRPVHRYLTQGSYQYKYYCHERLGLPLPSRRMSMAALNQAFPIQRIPSFTTYSTFPQLRHKVKVNNNVTANNVAVHRFPQAAPPRPPRVPVVQPPYHSYPRYAHSQKTFNQENRIAKWHSVPVFEWLVWSLLLFGCIWKHTRTWHLPQFDNLASFQTPFSSIGFRP